MSDTTYTSGVTVIEADSMNDINDVIYTALACSGGLIQALRINAQYLQSFCIQVINSAGTLQHRICMGPNNTTSASAFASTITGASTTLANTPTVGAGTGFTSGAGFVGGQTIVLNTAAQVATSSIAFATVEYYDGNVANPRVYPSFISRNVNGTTRVRLELNLSDAMTGSAWNFDTTNLPSGKSIFIRVQAFIA